MIVIGEQSDAVQSLVEGLKQPCKQSLTGRFTGLKRLWLLLSVRRAVQRGHFVCVMPRAGLMPLGALGVVGGRLMLPGSHMRRCLLMMRCGSFATVRSLSVLFLDFLCHGICFVLLLISQEDFTSVRDSSRVGNPNLKHLAVLWGVIPCHYFLAPSSRALFSSGNT